MVCRTYSPAEIRHLSGAVGLMPATRQITVASRLFEADHSRRRRRMTSVRLLAVAEQYPSRIDTSSSGTSMRISTFGVPTEGRAKQKFMAVRSEKRSRSRGLEKPAGRWLEALGWGSCGGLLGQWRQKGEQPLSYRMKLPHHITIERAAHGHFIHQRHRRRAERCQRHCQGCRRHSGLQRVGGHRFAAQ